MTIPDFFDSFNQDISWLKTNTIYLTLAGSRSYGTNTQDSDTDIKGICIPPKKYYLGYDNNFEQAELHNPDAVVFEIKKFFKLASNCNPNALECLFVSPEDIIHMDDLGQELLDNRELFLSKKAKFTMVGYAFGQLKDMKLHRGWLLNPPKGKPDRKNFNLLEQPSIKKDQLLTAQSMIKKELDKFQFNFLENLTEPEKIEIRAIMSEMLAGMQITSDEQWEAAARRVGFDENFIQLLFRERNFENALRDWNNYLLWKKNRNPARAILEEKYKIDLKNAYHLVRLIRMCREILTTGKVLVKRLDYKELLEIRNGAWNCEKIIEFAEREDKELSILYNTCNILPKFPDKEKLDKLCIKLIEKSLSRNV